ncbi:MAG: radical SAM protein [Marinifilaceae bacterium]
MMSRNIPNIDPNFEPAYLKYHGSGNLTKRADALWQRMESCDLCPRLCNANRLMGQRGNCGATDLLEIASFQAHFGEERPLVGTHGSGTIFFTHCSLRCVFCQNWDISHCGQGNPTSIEGLSEIMLYLQEKGCHNINLVTPDHFLPHILKALDLAVQEGLHLPIVYNTGGWVRKDILKTLDGIVDIYMPDFKYWSPEEANRYSPGAKSYPEIARQALVEMNRQVGVAKPARDGLLYRGLLIRHLVMPARIGGTREFLHWIGQNLPKDTYLNLMSQYHPAYEAMNYPRINRRISREEYLEALQWSKSEGLSQVETQSIPF